MMMMTLVIMGAGLARPSFFEGTILRSLVCANRTINKLPPDIKTS